MKVRLPQVLWHRGVVAVASLTTPLVLSACASYPGADYARAACDDLSSLMQLASPRHADVELHAERAAARAQRAASLDGAFESLYADLRKIREAVHSGPQLEARAEERIDEVLSAVATVCADLESPIETPEGAGPGGVTWEALLSAG